MMRKHYIEFADSEPGAADVLDYNLEIGRAHV